MRALTKFWAVWFTATLAAIGGVRVLAFDAPRSSPASASELKELGAGRPPVGKVTMVYSPTACATGAVNCSSCGGHCCVCMDMGNVPSFGAGANYAGTTLQTCFGFYIYSFCIGGGCSGASSWNNGSCSINWLDYVDP